MRNKSLFNDVVVTLPRGQLKEWIDEGDPAGSEWSGTYWAWGLGNKKPKRIRPGDRVYVVYQGNLIGYSTLVKIGWENRRYVLIRANDAMVVTIDEEIKGFQGFRYRWWDRKIEKPFPKWNKL